MSTKMCCLVVRVLTNKSSIHKAIKLQTIGDCRYKAMIEIPAYTVRAAWSEGNAFRLPSTPVTVRPTS
jgi:hypothetical protein